MSKRHQACHDIDTLCLQLIQVINHQSVIDAAFDIEGEVELKETIEAITKLHKRATEAHRQCMMDEAGDSGTRH